MPVPKPRKGEKEDDFISRCISSLHRTDPDREHDQIVAICFDTWRNREQIGDVDAPAPSKWASDAERMHVDFLWVLKKYIRQWGNEGVKKFYAWVERAKVNITKPYLISTQRVQECLGGICEAFKWTDPLISYYKEDDEATYWKTLALTANVSMNRNDYENAYELAKASSSMKNKPLNWNHNHEMWLPFPDARVDLAAFEDSGLECIIRIPNDLKHYEGDKLVNDMIRDGDIIHVSVEGDPHGSVETEQGVAPLDYIFTALALLENDKTLPGDPLTTLEPLFLRESMGRSLVESLSVERIEEKRKMKKKTIEGKFEEETTELGEAKWTRAYINDLPNSAFAVTEGCADENKSARHLPYKNAEGSVDLPHLRNALARMNQIKAVCNGSDEALRRRARSKLVPLAKKHLPASQWAKEKTVEELLRESGIDGIDVCHQCRFFEVVPYNTETKPTVTGATTNAEVTTISGAVSTDVGRCRITDSLVRRTDLVCTSAMPSETGSKPRTPFESVGELVLKGEIADLEKDKLQLMQARNLEMEAHANTKRLLSETQDSNAKKDRDLAVIQTKVARLEKDRTDLLEKLDRATETATTTQIKADTLQGDLTFYKDDASRKTEIIGKQKENIARLKEELAKTKRDANDAAAQRAGAMQRAGDAEEGRADTLRENAILSEDLSTARQTNYDLSLRLAEQAKKIMKFEREAREEREAHRQAIVEFRELKEKYVKLKAQKIRKITVRA